MHLSPTRNRVSLSAILLLTVAFHFLPKPVEAQPDPYPHPRIGAFPSGSIDCCYQLEQVNDRGQVFRGHFAFVDLAADSPKLIAADNSLVCSQTGFRRLGTPESFATLREMVKDRPPLIVNANAYTESGTTSACGLPHGLAVANSVMLNPADGISDALLFSNNSTGGVTWQIISKPPRNYQVPAGVVTAVAGTFYPGNGPNPSNKQDARTLLALPVAGSTLVVVQVEKQPGRSAGATTGELIQFVRSQFGAGPVFELASGAPSIWDYAQEPAYQSLSRPFEESPARNSAVVYTNSPFFLAFGEASARRRVPQRFHLIGTDLMQQQNSNHYAYQSLGITATGLFTLSGQSNLDLTGSQCVTLGPGTVIKLDTSESGSSIPLFIGPAAPKQFESPEDFDEY